MQIPAHAKKVFQGVIFSVWQWEQQMFDGSTATFEALRRPATVQVIPTQNNHILLSFEEQPMKDPSFTLLGGRQEENEEPLVTAKRELLEEAGMKSDDWELYKTYQADGKIQWDTYLFIARDCEKVAEPHLDPGEKIELKKVTFNEFLSYVSNESFWGQQISNTILRIMLSAEKQNDLERKLFHT